MSDIIGELLDTTATGSNPIALGRLLTAIEDLGSDALADSRLLNPSHLAFRIGLTGPPGAGKSSLITRLLKELRRLDLSVGVLAVDPSSPFSKGAILGDRIRYSEHFNDPKVFIRSLGSRGSLGGLSASAYLMLRAYDHAGFDVVLIETVGVGQTELEIMNVADHIAVVLVPESGDSIQAMKAGLLEIADSYVINKFDRPGAESLLNELTQSVNSDPQATEKKVFPTIATTGQGIPEFAVYLLSQNDPHLIKNKRAESKRLQAEAQSLCRSKMEMRIKKDLEKIHDSAALLKFVRRIK